MLVTLEVHPFLPEVSILVLLVEGDLVELVHHPRASDLMRAFPI
jgi:hypothetical protein